MSTGSTARADLDRLISSEEQPASRSATAVRNAVAGVMAHGVSVLANIALVPILLHHLGPSRFGVWLTFQAMTAFSQFVDLGISNSALNAIATAQAKADHGLVRKIVSTTVSALLLLAIAALAIAAAVLGIVASLRVARLSAFDSDTDIVGGAIVFALYSALLVPLGFADRVVVAFQEGRIANVTRAASAVASVCAAWGAVLWNGSFTAICIATTLPSLVAWGLTWAYLLVSRPNAVPARLSWDWQLLRDLVRSGALFLGAQVTAVLAFALDSPLIAAVAGPSVVASYGAHAKLFGLINMLGGLILAPLWPAYADARAHDDSHWIWRTLRFSVAASAICSIAGAAVLLWWFPGILQMWLRSDIAPRQTLSVGLAIQSVLACVGGAYAMFWNGTHQLALQLRLGVLYVAVSLPLRACILATVGVDYYPFAIAATYALCVLLPAAVLARQFRPSSPPLPQVNRSPDEGLECGSKWDQWLADAWFVNRGRGWWARIYTSILMRLRRLRLRQADRPIQIRWCGHSLYAPFSHEMMRYVALFPEYNRNLGRLACAMSRVNGKPLFAVDVGANIGDTAVLIRESGISAVLCIEGSPKFFRYLQANASAASGISCVHSLVSYDGAPDHMTLQEGNGTARVTAAAPEESLPTARLEKLVADHGFNRTVHLLKIDTDGYDGKILLQNDHFVRTHRPVIFAEIDPFLEDEKVMGSSVEAALRMLRDIGYRRFIVFRNTGEAVCWYDLLTDIVLFVSNVRGHMFGHYADIAVFPVEKEPEWEAAAAEFRVAAGSGSRSALRSLFKEWAAQSPDYAAPPS